MLYKIFNVDFSEQVHESWRRNGTYTAPREFDIYHTMMTPLRMLCSMTVTYFFQGKIGISETVKASAKMPDAKLIDSSICHRMAP